MNLSLDVFNRLEIPNSYLAETNKELIGKLTLTALNGSLKANNISEINFTVPKFYDDLESGYIENEWYDLIESPRLLLVEGVGYFRIKEPRIVTDGIYEYKECIAVGSEFELSRKFLKEFIINMGTDGSIDGVEFCDVNNPQKSLLHLVLTKLPNWSVGHVDTLLATETRSFEIESQDIYSFLTQDVASSFGCIILFDNFTNTVNAYYDENVGEDTDIYISLRTIASKVEISYNDEEIITQLDVYGADDLNIRDCNMGVNTVLNLDYYHTVEWMGQELYDAWTNYIEKVQVNNIIYSEKINLYKEKLDIRNELLIRLPEVVTTDWTLYGLNGLKNKQSEYEIVLSTQATAGWANPTNAATANFNTPNPNYQAYLDTYNTIQDIKAEIEVREDEISVVELEMNTILSEMQDIATDSSMQNNFTTDQISHISTFVSEDNLQDDGFVVTDIMTDKEKFEVQESLRDFALRELSKVAKPQLAFSVDMANIYEIEEFRPLISQFDLMNYIHAEVRDGYDLKTRILEIHFDFFDSTNFNCVFGTSVRYSDGYDSYAELLGQATSITNSIPFEQSYWNKGGNAATIVDKLIAEGLDTALMEIKTTGQQHITWDETGIHLRRWNYDSNTFYPEEVWMTNDKILYSDDNFKSAKALFGKVTIDGISKYVVIAEAVLAGLVEASFLVGNEITNGNGFYVDKDGNMISTSGYIGSWKIGKDGLYHDTWKTGLWSWYSPTTYNQDGSIDHKALSTTLMDEVGNSYTGYLAYWAGATSEADVHDAPFRVYSDGSFFSTRGSLGNWTIGEFGLYYENWVTGLWGIDDSRLQITPHPIDTSYPTSSGVAIWAGNKLNTFAGIKSSPFIVTHDGHLYTTKGKIASFVINEKYLEADDRSIGFGTSFGSSDYALWVGWNPSYNRAAFRVTNTGKVVFDDLVSRTVSITMNTPPDIWKLRDDAIGDIFSYEYKDSAYYIKIGSQMKALYPQSNEVTDLGTANFRWKDLFVQGIASHGYVTTQDVRVGVTGGTALNGSAWKPSAISVSTALKGFETGGADPSVKDYITNKYNELKLYADNTFATKAELESAKAIFYENGRQAGYTAGRSDGIDIGLSMCPDCPDCPDCPEIPE